LGTPTTLWHLPPAAHPPPAQVPGPAQRPQHSVSATDNVGLRA
jgi:hypothetical protein